MYENRKIQNFIINYFNEHEYMKDKDPGRVTSILVFDYLMQNGYEDVAQKLALDILKSQELSECESESDESDEEVSKLTDPDRVAFTLVSDYLNKFGYQSIAQELQKEVKYSKLDLQGLDLQTISKRQISKSDSKLDPKQKVSKSKIVQVPEDQQPTRKRKLDNCDKTETKVEHRPKKPKPDEEPRQFEDLNRLVPIRNVFPDKVAMLEEVGKEFPETELVKVAKFILNDKVNVKKSIALTISASTNSISIKQKFPYLKKTKFSGKSYGEKSEESLLMKNWEKLVAKVPIFIPEKFVKDIQNTSNNSHLWIQKLLGAYLSQGFVHHRKAYQFYTTLIGLRMRKGSFGEEENEKLLEFDKQHNGKPTTNDWKALAFEMERQSNHLQSQLKVLKESKDVSKTLKNTRYTLEDEKKILTYLNEHFDIGKAETLKSLASKDFQPLVKELHRGERQLSNHFHGTLLPILLGNIYGSLNMQWEDDFFKYIIDQKVACISDVNWNHLLKEKPFLTKKRITLALKDAGRLSKIKGPLYEQIAAFRNRIPTGRSAPEMVDDRKRKINQIYDNIIEAKLNTTLSD